MAALSRRLRCCLYGRPFALGLRLPFSSASFCEVPEFTKDYSAALAAYTAYGIFELIFCWCEGASCGARCSFWPPQHCYS